jgi:hypothetical protein
MKVAAQESNQFGFLKYFENSADIRDLFFLMVALRGFLYDHNFVGIWMHQSWDINLIFWNHFKFVALSVFDILGKSQGSMRCCVFY